MIEILFVAVVLLFGRGSSVDDKNQLVCDRRSHVDIVIPGSELSDFAVTADMGSNQNFLICDDCRCGTISIPWLSESCCW